MTKFKRTAAVIAAAMMLAAPIAQNTRSTQIKADAVGIASEEDSSDILLDCSSRYGYDFLGKLSNGKDMQKMYDAIWDESVRLWNATDENVPLGENLGETGLRLSLTELDLPQSDVEKVVYMFRYDNPIFFWISGNVYFKNGEYIYTVEREFSYGEERAKVQTAVENYVKKTADDAFRAYQNKYYRSLMIHDELINKTDDLGYQSDDYRDYTIYGAIINHRAVSEGFSRTYQLLLNYIDLENYYFMGRLDGHDQACNLIRYDDDKCYFADVQLDAAASDNNMNGNSTAYLGKGTKEFLENRIIYTDNPDDPRNFQPLMPTVAVDNYDRAGYMRKFLRGDANMDEKITVTDISAIAAHVKGVKTLSNYCQPAADADRNKVINVTDISLVAAQVKGIRDIPQE